ncbi:MAG TPA: histidinol-phosphatase [Bacilli bacterium]|nr:histidinol-phosphatase [Bacilli bacterium]HQD91766.1 histidinol-phosphatase [Bacilli bacterium]
MITSNYHTHTYLCRHAQGKPEDYIKRAIEVGYKEIGISDHGPIFSNSLKRMSLDEFHQIYLKELNEAIEKYQYQITIYKGLEVEYLADHKDSYQYLLNYLDYLILGQHIVFQNDKVVTVYSGMNEETIYLYAYTVVEALNTKLFRILAHPDIFMFSYPKWDEHCKKVSRIIIEAAIKNNCLLEINANGARRGKILNENNEERWIYPRLEFWKIVSNEYRNAQVIISDDAHTIKDLHDNATLGMYKFAKELNLNVVDKIF